MSEEKFDRLSYALGLSMGNNFRASGIDSIDFATFADGVMGNRFVDACLASAKRGEWVTL